MSPAPSALKRLIPVLKVLVAAGLIAFLVWLVPFLDHLALSTSAAPDRRVSGRIMERSTAVLRFVTRDDQTLAVAVDPAADDHILRVTWPDGTVETAPAEPPQPWEVELGLITVVRNADLMLLFAALVMIFVASLVAVFRWDLLLSGAGLPTGFRRAFSLTFIGAFFNNIMPGLTGGDLVKAIYIAREHGQQKTAAIITVLLDRVLGITGLAIVAALVIPVDFQRYRMVAPWIFGLLGVISVLGVVFFSRRIRSALRFDALLARLPLQQMVRKADEAVFLYRFRLGLVGGSVLLSLVVHTIIIASFAVIGRSIGMTLDALSYFAIIPIALIVSALPIAPAGWGVGEAASVFFLGTVGVPRSMALALFLIYRIEQLAISLIGGACLALEKNRVSTAEVESFGDESSPSPSE